MGSFVQATSDEVVAVAKPSDGNSAFGLKIRPLMAIASTEESGRGGQGPV
jgi:hypothetical protein